eukprot:TRINITY_DN3089_c0_g1_i1.p1 TRINITY_DN3089_c0_g1~~TRINITY_DN3089_c0_g1_i1.p1  ORF type:complete len:249 (+),score=41.45 TRINITY_DN3089_c0_g1_i1:717-1463(+)
MLILLEAKEPGYKELFMPALKKLKDLQSSVAFKAVHSQVAKVISLLTGVQETKPVAEKPVVPLPDLDIVTQKQNILDIPLFDAPAPNPQPTKLDPFTFMSQAKTEPKKEETKADLFANLKLKANNNEPAKAPVVQSSFTFLKKEKEPEKKSTLQGLDLDFAAADTPAPKPSDLLSAIDLAGHFEHMPPQRPVIPQPPQCFAPGAKQGAVLIPQSLYVREEKRENKNDDKYFGFVNEELQWELTLIPFI